MADLTQHNVNVGRSYANLLIRIRLLHHYTAVGIAPAEPQLAPSSL